jgi:endonuclease/exonuclease/phosphatase family metal-dependent hydrolase
MKRFYYAALALITAAGLVLAGCNFTAGAKAEEVRREAGTLTLMTWNVHNLFDGEDNGFEYNEFLGSAGWSQEKYKGRINTLSAAIGKLNPLPDIICLQEIESVKILEELGAAMSGNYQYSHFAGNPGAALGVGILSRIPLLEPMTHSITVIDDATPRPVLETRIQADESEFVLFACHWKSKLGGDDETETVRRASARVILRRIRELWKTEPDLGVIIAGDLNECHDEFYRRNAAAICALLPDDPYCALITGAITDDGSEVPEKQKDFIVLGKNKPPSPEHFPQGTVVLFSPWLRDLKDGSYYYKHNWETIDHFLVSAQFFNNKGWSYIKTAVVNYPPFADASGGPIPYNMRTGAGLSDHLPLLLTLKNDL